MFWDRLLRGEQGVGTGMYFGCGFTLSPVVRDSLDIERLCPSVFVQLTRVAAYEIHVPVPTPCSPPRYVRGRQLEERSYKSRNAKIETKK